MPTISALYAGLLGLLSIVLAAKAGWMRGQTKISIGDGGNPQMLLAMRRHANFVEYVPLTLVLLALVELGGGYSAAIHGLGIALVVARVCHAVGLKADTMQGLGRLIGAAGTSLILSIVSVWAIVTYFVAG